MASADGTKTPKVQGVHYVAPPNTVDEEKTPRYMTVTHATVIDLISEEGIEGLSSGNYEFDIANSRQGLDPNGNPYIGYAGYTFESNHSSNAEYAKLGSIYWNETPVLDTNSGGFNFTDIDVKTNQNTFRQNGFTSSKIKVVNERLRGPDSAEASPPLKNYQIINKNCSKVVIGIKIGALGSVDRYKGTPQDPNETYGELKDSSVHLHFNYRPLFSNKKVNFTHYGNEYVYGSFSQPYARDVELDFTAVPNSDNTDTFNAIDLYVDDLNDFLGWEVQVIRHTPEPRDPDVKNQTLVDSITEYTSNKLMAPQSFIVENKFNAETFGSIPDRAYDMRLQKVRIPSNYDPITRTYFDVWDGTFSDEVDGASYGKTCTDWENQTDCSAKGTRNKGLHWTDNPAWCFYDLIHNNRYGLGKYIDQISIDKWTLYEIAQYCDELVSDGFGGLEPRFSCNVLMQSREDAFQVLNDMASIFRALIYYSSGSIYAVQDSKKDAIFQFNNSNVENGDFNYTTTSTRVRHTVAVVRYNDKNNFYQPGVEYIDDADGIRRYGIKEKEITAFGCTSRGQAIRLGRWILSTERLETETVAFTTGMEGSLLRPGDVFKLADSNRLMNRRGGRVNTFTRVSNNQFTVLLDGKLEELDANRDYQLTLSAPSFFYDPSQVNVKSESNTQFIRNHHVQKFTITNSSVDYSSGSTGKSLVTVTCSGCLNDEGTLLNQGAVVENMSWSILGVGIDNAAANQEKQNQDLRYRVVNVAEKETGKYEISGVEYTEGKYEEVDSALTFTNTIDFQVPLGPDAVIFNGKTTPSNAPNTAVLNYEIDPNANINGLSYYAVYIKGGSSFADSSIPSVEFLADKIYSINTPVAQYVPSTKQNYYFRVYSVNSLGEHSSTYKELTVTATQVGDVFPIRDVKINSLRLTDNTLTNAAAASDPFQGPTGDTVDEYRGSSTQFTWATIAPNIQNVNIAFDFTYVIKIARGASTSGSDVVITYDNYRPTDWDLASTTFEFDLNKNIEANKSSNGNFNLEDALRDYTIIVHAKDANGVLSSSGGNNEGYDFLHVSNPAPIKPDVGCSDSNTDACIQAFIDLNNNIKIYNTSRPSDVSAVYIIAAKKTFTYQQFLDNAFDTTNDDWDFNIVKIPDIGNTDPVFEISPSFGRQTAIGVDPDSETIFDLEEAYVAIAYTDSFDEDIDDWQTLNLAGQNVSNYDIRKNLVSRISDSVRATKVTPDVVDLLGEGWKAWIKIDHNGNWFGNRIRCVKDVTDQYTSYKGYLPFYCTSRSPLLDWEDSSFGNTPGNIYHHNALSVIDQRDVYVPGCFYYLKHDATDTPPASDVQQVKKKGGYTTDTNTRSANDPNYPNETFQKGFKRFRVYFEKPKDPDNYWVVGMNVNDKPYYDTQLLKDVGALWKADDPATGSKTNYEEYFTAGAEHALAAATTAGEDIMIGGSDAYFNYHPAGFVQGFGGLPKTVNYFDVHVGHMVDNSYLQEAIFFVMARTFDEASWPEGPTGTC